MTYVAENINYTEELRPYGAPEDFDISDIPETIIDVEYTEETDTHKSTQLVAANDNNFPTFPTDPQLLPNYIAIAKKAIEAESLLLKGLVMQPYKYRIAFKQAQQHACLLLEAELKLGEILRCIKTRKGLRKDLERKIDKHIKTKKEIIATEFNLTPRQARDIEKLTRKCVDDAINYAKENNEIPTRALALSKLSKNVAEERGNYQYIGIMEDEHKTLNLKKPIYYTSLFANVGIGTYYLEQMGLHCTLSNEFLEERARWHEEIYPNCEMIVGDFSNPEVFEKLVRLHKEKSNKMLLASPPCQSFSKANTSKSKLTDKRTCLFETTLEFIRQTDNDYVLIENVPEFLNAKPKNINDIIGDKTIGEYIRIELEKLGYIVNIGVFSAADYGTCQNRERALILAAKKELGIWKFPKKDKVRKLLFEAIGDLPSLEPGEHDPKRPFHYAPPLKQCQIDFLKHTPTACSAWENSKEYKPVNVDGTSSGAKFKTSFMRKDWNKPCNTITTKSENIGGLITIHPGHPLSDGTYSDCRPLSILELFRVTGLPDDYPVPSWAVGKDDLIRDVIGECFAPLHVSRLMTTLPL